MNRLAALAMTAVSLLFVGIALRVGDGIGSTSIVIARRRFLQISRCAFSNIIGPSTIANGRT
jgi:hypothetical protein